jgi:hypothetical protein
VPTFADGLSARLLRVPGDVKKLEANEAEEEGAAQMRWVAAYYAYPRWVPLVYLGVVLLVGAIAIIWAIRSQRRR